MNPLRSAFRKLRQHPGITLAVLLTLIPALAANVALFSVVDDVLLTPLPFDEAQELVHVWPEGALLRGGFDLYRERSRMVEDPAGYDRGSKMSLTGVGEARRVDATAVTPGLFRTLRVEAAHGRTFQPGDDQPGRDRLVVLSHDFWSQRLGGDPSWVNRSLRLDGETRQVVGVMPEGFGFPDDEVDMWVPATLDSSDVATYWGGPGALNAIGRLPDGDLDAASQELRSLLAATAETVPWDLGAQYGQTAAVRPLRESLVGDLSGHLLLLQGAVLLVLLIACVNVANLLLVQSRERQGEMAIRSALGAGQGKLLRQLLTESLLLTGLSGLGGLIIGLWGASLLRAQLPDTLQISQGHHMGGRTVLFMLVVTLLTGLLVGLFPALRARRPNLQGILKDSGGRSAGGGRKHLAGVLTVSQVALAVVLVIGSGLMVRSFLSQVDTDPGFRSDRVLTAVIDPPTFRYSDDPARRRFFDRVVERLSAVRSVEKVGLSDRLPFSGEIYGAPFAIEGRPLPARGADWPLAEARFAIDGDYLEALGIPVLRGRTFTAADRAESPGVALVSESLAEEYWSGTNPLGQRIQIPGSNDWLTIVGVVGDVKLKNLTDPAASALYRPLDQTATGTARIVARTGSDPAAITEPLRSTVQQLDADTPVAEVGPLAIQLTDSLQEQRMLTITLTAFAALSLLLGGIGVFGVVAHTIERRRREIALRMAMGARKRSVLWSVIRQGGTLIALGVGVGLALAAGLGRVLESHLYGVSARDPWVFVAVPLLFAIVALLATALPAQRAARLDPASVLRES